MSQDTEFLARVLRTGSRAYAAYATNDLLGSTPDARVGFGADPLSVWQNWMAVRVEELAAAVAVEQPKLFTTQVHWCKAVLTAQGVSVEHFRSALTGLKHVLANELPDRVRALAAQKWSRDFTWDESRLKNMAAADLPEGKYSGTLSF